MKKPQSQAGFAALEAILIVVILGVAGFVGHYVYTANNKATDTYDAASDTSSTPVISSKGSTASTQSGATKSSATTTSPKSTTTTVSNTDAAKVQAALKSSNPNDTQLTKDMNDANSALSDY